MSSPDHGELPKQNILPDLKPGELPGFGELPGLHPRPIYDPAAEALARHEREQKAYHDSAIEKYGERLGEALFEHTYQDPAPYNTLEGAAENERREKDFLRLVVDEIRSVDQHNPEAGIRALRAFKESIIHPLGKSIRESQRQAVFGSD